MRHRNYNKRIIIFRYANYSPPQKASIWLLDRVETQARRQKFAVGLDQRRYSPRRLRNCGSVPVSYWVNVREVKRVYWQAFAHFWEVTFADSPVLPQGEGGESEVCAADVNRRWGG